MALIHSLRGGGSASGVLITDRCQVPRGDGSILFRLGCCRKWYISFRFGNLLALAQLTPGEQEQRDVFVKLRE
jgi:hypothetical protein